MKQIGIAWALAVLLSSAVGAEIEGLVGYWPFDEAGGEVAGDASGNENDGTIHGAAFVKSPKGHALGFDGVDDFVACGASKSLQQLERAGTIELWFKPEELQGGLVNWSTGSGWEDERLVVAFKARKGTVEFLHAASDGTGLGKHARQYDLDMPVKNSWNHLALTFDGGTITYHLDGRMRRVHSRKFARSNLEGVPLWIGRCQGLGKEFFKGTMDEIRIYNRALSDEEILAHYKEDAAAFGKDTSVFQRPEIRIEVFPEPGWIAVEVDYGLMRPLPEGSSVEVQILDAQGAKTLARKAERIQPQTMTLNVVLNAVPLQPGNYLTRTSIIAADGSPIGRPVAQSVSWPGQSEAFKGVKILNNVVWELLSVESGTVDGTRAYAFKSPKTRWAYVVIAADASEGGLDISLDGYEKIISFEKGEKGTKESMRFLPEGEHQLGVRSGGPCRIETLVVRSIPVIYSHEFLGEPFIKLDMSPGDFIEKYVMSNVNTFSLGGSQTDHPFFRKWQAASRGRWRWLTGTSGLWEAGDLKPLTVEQAYEHVSTTGGFLSPLLDGIIFDEFGNSDPLCAVYAEAVRKLAAEPKYKGKLFYAYANHLYTGEDGIELMKAVSETGAAIAWKRYLKTQSNVLTARAFLQYELVERARAWRNGFPQSLECIAVCIGYFTRPGGHLLNSTPSVNFKTHLDMEFNIVANHPAFWGTYGLMAYHSNYNDEETIRWMVRLFRHYGIDGRTEPATDEPYLLSHIENPDFINGTEGWTLEPAEKGSIRPVFKRGFGWHQARVGRTEGDTSLLTVRSARRPNRFSQEIENLQPGRLYSFRMFTGDHKDMSKKEQHAVRIQIENATLFPKKGFTYVHSNAGGSRAYPPYTEEGSAWLNYYWRIFRANGTTAKLIVSDWADDDNPGGAIGQELMYNYVQVQSYYAPEK